MEYVDLHVHSNASDGTMIPWEVVCLGAKIGLSALALTDHDTIKGIKEALAASAELFTQGKEIMVIPGIELSAAYGKSDIHILGLFIDFENDSLKKALESTVKERDNRNELMIKNLQKAGLDITTESLKTENKNSVITRAHFAKYLVKQGYCKNNEDAFKKYLRADGPYYVGRKYMTPEYAIEIIKAAGGIPILAHPILYNLKEGEIKNLVRHLKDVGLMGLEVMHSNHLRNEEIFLRSLARSMDLLISGGSDFHGAAKPDIHLGIGRGNLKVPLSILENLENVL